MAKTIEQKKRDVRISRASSRKELAALVHDLVLPTLGQIGNNLEYLKRKFEDIDRRLSLIEQARSPEPGETIAESKEEEAHAAASI